jgi:tetratricopeptide (TPR) repeat protein
MAGQYKKALEAHQRADSLAPNDPFNLAAWGLAFYAARDWRHAAKLWERTKQLAPDYWATRKDLHALY